jgi:hypothetical protein
MTTSAERDRWVNAVVETWISLDDVTPGSSPAEKFAAAERAVDSMEIPEGLVHVVRWEDAPSDDALRDQRQDAIARVCDFLRAQTDQSATWSPTAIARAIEVVAKYFR